MLHGGLGLQSMVKRQIVHSFSREGIEIVELFGDLRGLQNYIGGSPCHIDDDTRQQDLFHLVLLSGHQQFSIALGECKLRGTEGGE